jgi:hypothetical protein
MQERQKVGAEPQVAVRLTQIKDESAVGRGTADDTNACHGRPSESQNRSLQPRDSGGRRFRRLTCQLAA